MNVTFKNQIINQKNWKIIKNLYKKNLTKKKKKLNKKKNQQLMGI